MPFRDESGLKDVLVSLALSCSGDNRRYVIGRDILPKLRKMQRFAGTPMIAPVGDTLLGLPYDVVPGGRIGITCDTPTHTVV